MNTKPLYEYMMERHKVYLRKTKGDPKPWTKDTILQTYRFCNVYRELDTVTEWIDANIRRRFRDHPQLWFMLCIARQINWPDTLMELMAAPTAKQVWPHTPNKWNPLAMREAMLKRAARGDKLYTGAYMLRGPIQGDPSGFQDKPHYTAVRVLAPLWRDRSHIPPNLSLDLREAHKTLTRYHGWGGFMAYEVVTDLRWTHYLEGATDILSWAYAGPGAVRGLNRLVGRPYKSHLSPYAALVEMQMALSGLRKRWPDGLPKLEMREVEHSLCEFDKYERVRLGEGRPRSLYAGI